MIHRELGKFFTWKWSSNDFSFFRSGGIEFGMGVGVGMGMNPGDQIN